jgi:hypothetical protein
MATARQKLWQERNWSKARLVGFITGIEQMTLTTKERATASKAKAFLKEILKEWDNSNRTVREFAAGKIKTL